MFGELPILADLLEDAGCPDRPLLNHCRDHGSHFRGCAALERLVGVGRAEPAPDLRLVCISGGYEGRVWWFSYPFEIGLLAGRFLAALQPYSVSRRHAAVSRDAAGWRVTDQGSTNGTWINGNRLGADPAGPLRGGDIVRFALVAFRVVSAAPGV